MTVSTSMSGSLFGRSRVLAVFASVALTGCMVGDEGIPSGDESDEDGAEVGADDLGIAHEHDPSPDETDGNASLVVGAWNPTAAVRAAGDRQYVPYTGAGAWSGGANCTGGLKAGTRMVGDFVATFPGVSGYGGYSCRPNTANTAQVSVHGTGRALDIMIPMVGGSANNARGDVVAAYLLEHAEAMGVQFVIWDHMQWQASRGAPKLRPYTGPNPHTDHIHVELSPQGAAKLSSWFRDPGQDGTPPAGGTQATVTNADALNLRTGPGVENAVLRTLPRGAVVTLVGAPSGNWYKVSYEGTTGWCSGTYLTL